MRNHDGRLSVKDGLADLHTHWDIIRSVCQLEQVYPGRMVGDQVRTKIIPRGIWQGDDDCMMGAGFA